MLEAQLLKIKYDKLQKVRIPLETWLTPCFVLCMYPYVMTTGQSVWLTQNWMCCSDSERHSVQILEYLRYSLLTLTSRSILRWQVYLSTSPSMCSVPCRKWYNGKTTLVKRVFCSVRDSWEVPEELPQGVPNGNLGQRFHGNPVFLKNSWGTSSETSQSLPQGLLWDFSGISQEPLTKPKMLFTVLLFYGIYSLTISIFLLLILQNKDNRSSAPSSQETSRTPSPPKEEEKTPSNLPSSTSSTEVTHLIATNNHLVQCCQLYTCLIFWDSRFTTLSCSTRICLLRSTGTQK